MSEDDKADLIAKSAGCLFMLCNAIWWTKMVKFQARIIGKEPPSDYANAVMRAVTGFLAAVLGVQVLFGLFELWVH
jgi:hypothetical protein